MVVVRKDDPAEKVWDTKDYVYGVQSIEDDSEMAEAMKKVNADAGKKVLTKDFDTLHDQVAGLFSETVDAIVSVSYTHLLLSEKVYFFSSS